MKMELSVDCLSFFDSNLKKIGTVSDVYPAWLKNAQSPNMPLVNIWIRKSNGNTKIVNIPDFHMIWCGMQNYEKNPLNKAVEMKVFIGDELLVSGLIEDSLIIPGYRSFKQYLNGSVTTYQVSNSLMKYITIVSYRPVDEALLTFI